MSYGFLCQIEIKLIIIKIIILIAIRLKLCVIELLQNVFFAFVYIPDRYKTQEICGSVVSEDPFMVM